MVAWPLVRSGRTVHLGWIWLAIFALPAFVTTWPSHDVDAMAPLTLFTASVDLAIYL